MGIIVYRWFWVVGSLKIARGVEKHLRRTFLGVEGFFVSERQSDFFVFGALECVFLLCVCGRVVRRFSGVCVII